MVLILKLHSIFNRTFITNIENYNLIHKVTFGHNVLFCQNISASSIEYSVHWSRNKKQTTSNCIKLNYFSGKQTNDSILKCLKSQIFTLIFTAFQEIDWLKCFSFFGVKDIGCILQNWIWNMTHAVQHSLRNDKIQFYICTFFSLIMWWRMAWHISAIFVIWIVYGQIVHMYFQICHLTCNSNGI